MMRVLTNQNGVLKSSSHHGDKQIVLQNHPHSTTLFQYTQDRQHGLTKTRHRGLASDFIARHLPGLMTEKEYDLERINKIFAAKWVSDRQVVYGTKCNKLIVMDLITKQMAQIPSLKSSETSKPAPCPCGIHSIATNPSMTMLATGGENTNDLAVYRLPTFDPVCIGEEGHRDWIFDIKWLDDRYLVTGSRDNNMALWRVEDDDDSSPSSQLQCLQVPEYVIKKPLAIKSCKKAEKVRALAYNEYTTEIAALSLNAHIHIWDATRFCQKMSRKLHYPRENVCMCINQRHNVYAVGSQSHVTVVDPRAMKNACHVQSQQKGCGIRSVNFNEEVLSIGTGAGAIYFWDLRARKYLELACGHPCALGIGKGWLLHDDTYMDFFTDQDYPNAVYAHCFDDSGTKLFAAGGPLPAGLWGNYAGLWY